MRKSFAYWCSMKSYPSTFACTKIYDFLVEYQTYKLNESCLFKHIFYFKVREPMCQLESPFFVKSGQIIGLPEYFDFYLFLFQKSKMSKNEFNQFSVHKTL